MSAMRGAPDIKSSNTTRISDDKLNKLAHTIADTLAEIDDHHAVLRQLHEHLEVSAHQRPLTIR